jgi:drug/metabolite transporter (DMT)-like permease
MTQELKFNPARLLKAERLSVLLPLLIAVMILSCSAIFTRLSEQELTPLATVFDRFWLASIVLGTWSGIRAVRPPASLPPTRTLEPLTKLDYGLMALLSVAIAARAGSWAWSLTQTTVANSNLLHNMTPIFATLGGWIFFGHRFDRRFLVGLVLALTGVVAIGIHDLHLTTEGFWGDLAALMSSVFYAINFLVIERLRRKLTATAIMTWSCVLVSGLLLPCVLVLGHGFIPHSPSAWTAILCLGVLSQSLGQSLIAYVLKRLNSGHVSIFLLLEPLLTALLAWIIFGERLSPSNWLAFGIILAGLYLAIASTTVQAAEPQS